MNGLALACSGLGLGLAALAIYPGELSWFSRNGTRWLYNRAAKNYSAKHHRHDYALLDAFIAQHMRRLSAGCSNVAVLDLGCGSGRATLASAQSAGADARYTAVDFSSAMLAGFRKSAGARALLGSGALKLCEAELETWLRSRVIQGSEAYDLVLMMEVGEFLPKFPEVLDLVAALCAPGATVLMTRPAGLWAWCFPRRTQTRKGLTRALARAGFEDLQFERWRSRYELLSCRRVPAGP